MITLISHNTEMIFELLAIFLSIQFARNKLTYQTKANERGKHRAERRRKDENGEKEEYSERERERKTRYNIVRRRRKRIA